MFSIPLHWVTSRGHASPEKSKSCLHVHVLICILYYIIMFYPAVNWHGHGKMDRLPKGKPSLAQIYASWPQGVCIYIYVCVYNMLHAYIYTYIFNYIYTIYVCVCLSIYQFMYICYLFIYYSLMLLVLVYLLIYYAYLFVYFFIELFIYLYFSLSLCPRACVHVYVGVCESAWSLLLLLCVTMGIISMITVS